MLEVLTFNLSNIQGSPDLKAAREVADYIGTRHHEFHFTVQVVTVFIILSLFIILTWRVKYSHAMPGRYRCA